MTACTRVRLTGSIDVGLPPVQAFTLFTPTGERAWAHGWDPEFPSPAADDTEPGVVFRTRHGDRVTTWTVTGSEPELTCTDAMLVRFGLPAIGGVRTEILWEHSESGETEEDIASEFDLPVSSVRWALAYETSARVA